MNTPEQIKQARKYAIDFFGLDDLADEDYSKADLSAIGSVKEAFLEGHAAALASPTYPGLRERLQEKIDSTDGLVEGAANEHARHCYLGMDYAFKIVLSWLSETEAPKPAPDPIIKLVEAARAIEDSYFYGPRKIKEPLIRALQEALKPYEK